MKKTLAVVLISLLGLLAPLAAMAQDAPAATPAPKAATPAAPAAPAAEPAPAPAPEPAPAPAPAPEPEPEPAPMPAEPEPMAAAEPEDDGGSVDGWFRIDNDQLGTQFWVGATHDLGGVALATDVYVVGTTGELDIGIAFDAGPIAFLPMIGIAVDFATQKAFSLIAPQLFTIVDADSVYFESWIQVFLLDLFDNAPDQLYTRNFLLLKASDHVQVGPQFELLYNLKNGGAEDIAALPIGLRMNVHYGENNTLGLFAGFDVKGEDNGRGKLAGRITFIRTW